MFDFFGGKIALSISERLAGLLPPIPALIVAAKPLPPEDDPNDRVTSDLGLAEGQSFMIEYIDAKGHASTRRITVFAVVEGASGVPLLTAKCHERQAMRQFRIDRIQSCIDFDGEVFSDVPAFMVETFGMSLQQAKRESSASERWQSVVAKIRPRAALLAAVSRSDGVVRSSEVETAALYLAKFVERDGEHMLEAEEFERIVAYLQRLRPTQEALLRSIEYLRTRSESDVLGVLRACISVMRADGKEDPAEIDLINEVSRDLVGMNIV